MQSELDKMNIQAKLNPWFDMNGDDRTKLGNDINAQYVNLNETLNNAINEATNKVAELNKQKAGLSEKDKDYQEKLGKVNGELSLTNIWLNYLQNAARETAGALKEVKLTATQLSIKQVIKDTLSGKGLGNSILGVLADTQQKSFDVFLNQLSPLIDRLMEDVKEGVPPEQLFIGKGWEDIKKQLKDPKVIGGMLGTIVQGAGSNSTWTTIGSTIGGLLPETLLGGWGGAIGAGIGFIADMFSSRPSPSSQQTTQMGELNRLFGEYASGGQNFYSSGWNQFWGNASKDIQETINNIAKVLSTTVDDFGSAIGSAFSDGGTYISFLSNWNTNLYNITKSALIKAFEAQSVYASAFANISNIMTQALLDGVLSSSEIAAIKQAGNSLSEKMKLLYQMLHDLGLDFGTDDTGSGGSNNYSAGNSTPISYQVSIQINSQAFMGDEDDARTFANLIGRLLEEEAGRA
jgi:hypothetical protein